MSRIWLDRRWFIEVDEQGYVTRSDEGTLGCILQMRHARDDGTTAVDGLKHALKLPRLLADTTKENAYICEIADDEIRNVMKSHIDGNQGLLTAQTGSQDWLLGKRTTSDCLHIDGAEQNGCILLFQFSKTKRPRVCAVRKDDEFIVFPEGCRSDVEFIEQSWEAIVESSKVGDIPFQSPFYATSNAEAPAVGTLFGQMSVDHAAERPWFGGLPSVAFVWATGTLQQALGTGLVSNWSISDHLSLVDGVLLGLDSLHKKELLHCDIRPANIMSEGAPERAESYRVGDYGSFSIGKARLGAAPSGQTMIGPGVGANRACPFYASERRAGTEREIADTAIILSRKVDPKVDVTGFEFVVRLGWASSLFDNGDKNVSQELRQDILNHADSLQRQEKPLSAGDLVPNDRLRLRDYIMEVKAASSLGQDGLLAICSGRFAHVLHDRLAVYNTPTHGENRDVDLGIDPVTVISLPSFTEYRQWSVATDLYSVGAMTLYTPFVTSASKKLGTQPPGSSTDESDDSTPEVHSADLRAIDERFAEMLEILENESYFRSFWEDLSTFWDTLESLVGSPEEITTDRAKAFPVQHQATKGVSATEHEVDDSRSAFSLRAVNNLVQSAPHIKTLLQPFARSIDKEVKTPAGNRANAPSTKLVSVKQYNAAAFLLLMHFVMACLHRRSHLLPSDRATASMFPFCVDRCQLPQSEEDRPTMTARDHLETILKILDKQWMDAFFVDDDDVPDFSPRNEYHIRIQHAAWRKAAVNALGGKEAFFGKSEKLKALEELANQIAGPGSTES